MNKEGLQKFQEEMMEYVKNHIHKEFERVFGKEQERTTVQPTPAKPTLNDYNTVRTYEDGIYLMLNNGTAIPFTGQKLDEYTPSITGIGVKDGSKSLVVDLEDITSDEVALTTMEGGTRFIKDFHEATEDMDGKTATEDIRDILNVGFSGQKGRHIPSLGELYFIFANFTQINAALKAAGGKPLQDGWYWSSTQYSATYAWRLGFGSGYASGNTKASYQGRVRPVSAFSPKDAIIRFKHQTL